MIRDGKTMLLDPDPLLGCNAKCSSLQPHQQEGLSQPLSCGHLCTQPCGKCCELTLLSAELPHVGIFVYYSFAIMWPLSHLDKIKQKNFYFIRYLTTNSKDTPRWSVHVALQPSISVRAPVRSYSVSRLQRMPSLYQAMPYKMPSYKVWRGLYSLLVNFLFFFFFISNNMLTLQRCGRSCLEPCPPCAEPCVWNCPHRGACPLPCGGPCIRLPCDMRFVTLF